MVGRAYFFLKKKKNPCGSYSNLNCKRVKVRLLSAGRMTREPPLRPKPV